MRIRRSWQLLAAACCASAAATFAMAQSDLFRPGFTQLESPNSIRIAIEAEPVPDYDGGTRAYCEASSQRCDFEKIALVQFVDINNPSECPAPANDPNVPKYSDFTAISTTVARNGVYPILVVVNPFDFDPPGDKVRVWIDWNQDETFDDAVYPAGERYNLAANTSNGQFTGNIHVPVGATLGQTRMRIRLEWATDPGTGPCGTIQYGEVEDYTVNVIAAAPEGACCVGGNCSGPMPASTCNSQGGTYLGDGSQCTDPNPCQGGCCLGGLDNCQVTTQAGCATLAGDYQGGGTTCDACPKTGDTCDTPVVVTIGTDFAGYSDTNRTCGRFNSIPVSSTNCLGSFAGGEDLVYRLDVAQDICVDILVQNLGPDSNFAVVIDDQCVGTPCLYGLAHTSGQVLLESVLLPASPENLYLVIDSQTGCMSDIQVIIIPAAAPCATGACCGGAGGCTDNIADVNCFLQGGVYLGDGSTCDFATDCNGNGTPDICDILTGNSDDCNGNDIPDDCEINSTTDADGNGVLDACDPDCNNNGVPDACELNAGLGNCATVYPALAGTGEDCNNNGILDACEGDPLWQQQWDTGFKQGNLGFAGATAYFAGIVSFDVEAGHETIYGVRVAWPVQATILGLPYSVYIWSDPNQDGNPADAQVLRAGTGNITITNPNSSTVQAVFQNHVLPPITLNVGQKYFVGFIIQTVVAPGNPLSFDFGPNNQRSWLIASQTGFTPPIDPNDLGAAYSIALNTMANIGFPYNLMIRPMGALSGPVCLPSSCPGDSNGDGVVNFADISPFIAAIKAGNAGNWTCNLGAGFGPYLNSDANGDGVVNFADISPFIGLLKAPPPPCVSVCP
ncbi:MAG: hypothetical protein IPM18_03655 [Phycisphaerales bacterium]|nr:hypothetical protein [Phycisphaerales bacterium]